MTATDELRRLLDGRGVECRQTEWIDGITVRWRGSDGSEYGARNGLSFDGPTGGLVLYDLTPAQAVEATLGSDLQAENEKLRELVRDMWNWLAPTAINGGAPLQMIVTHMRMLGVEV